jgi:hypothetical protein
VADKGQRMQRVAPRAAPDLPAGDGTAVPSGAIWMLELVGRVFADAGNETIQWIIVTISAPRACAILKHHGVAVCIRVPASLAAALAAGSCNAVGPTHGNAHGQGGWVVGPGCTKRSMHVEPPNSRPHVQRLQSAAAAGAAVPGLTALELLGVPDLGEPTVAGLVVVTLPAGLAPGVAAVARGAQGLAVCRRKIRVIT